MKRIIVGLTGGIASGKSAVSSIFSQLGAYVIDADKISREIMDSDGGVLAEIEKAFPGTVTSGVLDRLALKKVAFSSSTNTRKLNSITHPAIFKRINREIASAPNGVVVLDVPLLFETGAEKLCDKTITVACSQDIRIERLISRDNVDIALARDIISKQMSDEERNQRADYVVYNQEDLHSLKSKVVKLYSELEKLC